MPKDKKKKEESDSSSDSGPDDVEPPKKKTKGGSSGNSSRMENEDEPTWKLEKTRLVKVREFRGKVFVDIREFYEKDGELLPGKKGISLTPFQWNKLKEIADEIDEAVRQKC